MPPIWETLARKPLRQAYSSWYTKLREDESFLFLKHHHYCYCDHHSWLKDSLRFRAISQQSFIWILRKYLWRPESLFSYVKFAYSFLKNLDHLNMSVLGPNQHTLSAVSRCMPTLSRAKSQSTRWRLLPSAHYGRFCSLSSLSWGVASKC